MLTEPTSRTDGVIARPVARRTRLAVITTHPIQYNAPWFRHMSATGALDLRVFYLWDFGVRDRYDPAFRQTIRWDVPLLDGYAYEFVPNGSPRPGTDHVLGLWNPSLARRVRAFAPDAVLLLTYNFATIYRFLVEWRRGEAPLLFRGDSHRIGAPGGLRAGLRRRVVGAVLRRFDAALYVGQANRRYFELHGVPQSKLFFAPHAVDNARFMAAGPAARDGAARWRAELGIPADHRVVLFAGKLEEKKRPLDLLEAFVRADVPRASLLFVGGGSLEGPLRAAAAGHAHVFFAPFQNQTAMPRTYQAGDVFVLPSFGTGETWGLAVNEAMCLGRPVIVSTHVGCAEDLVEPYRNGLTFPAGDVSALAGALREALADDARLGDWGLGARERVGAYSYDRATEGVMRALDALRRSGRAAAVDGGGPSLASHGHLGSK